MNNITMTMQPSKIYFSFADGSCTRPKSPEQLMAILDSYLADGEFEMTGVVDFVTYGAAYDLVIHVIYDNTKDLVHCEEDRLKLKAILSEYFEQEQAHFSRMAEDKAG